MEPLPAPKRLKLIDRKLLIRQGIFLIIAFIMLLSAEYDVFVGDLTWWLSGLALLIGFVVGYVVSQFRSITWHESKEQVVSQLDVVGVAAIVVYIAFDLSKNWLFGHFFSGVALSAFTLSVLAGLLIGRFFGTGRSIRKALRNRPVSS